jgi:hypothetical protein
MSASEDRNRLMATMIDQDGSLALALEVEAPEGAKAGDVFELECMAQVASVTTTIDGEPDRLLLHFYEMRLDKNIDWTPPVVAPQPPPLVEPLTPTPEGT